MLRAATPEQVVKFLKIAGGIVVTAALAAGGFYGWAVSTTTSKMATTFETHRADFPIPFPLTEAELTELRTERLAAMSLPAANDPNAPVTDAAEPPIDPLAGVDLDALARERAVARGKHLVESLYPCTECHGADFGGGTMVDDPAVGKMLGANLTTGKGSKTLTYTAADWDRIVRHGVKPDNTGSPMPAKDFFAMSDRELSDIVSYIRSLPPVDKEVEPVSFGPVLNVLVATGQVPLSAQEHPGHDKAHVGEPPPAAADATYGGHITQVCTGCHRADFTGGPVAGGPPDWPPAANLTPAGLKGWTYEDFDRAMLEGKKKDGTPLKAPMDGMAKFAKNMTETERQAMWAYLQTLPPVETQAAK
jgi:mono/diheme cytochrome c family protein